MNTVSRMVSGALGVAVIGSLVNSLYADDLESRLAAVPAPARDAAAESIGAAHAIAGQLPAPAGSALMAEAGDAFVSAMGAGLLLAAAMSLATAVVVARVLRRRPAEEAAPARAQAPSATSPVR
jgi:MFS transporter, DHA2 family, multidrug resistance protein